MDRAMAMQRRNVANCGVRRRKVLREKSMGSSMGSHRWGLDGVRSSKWASCSLGRT